MLEGLKMFIQYLKKTNYTNTFQSTGKMQFGKVIFYSYNYQNLSARVVTFLRIMIVS